MLESKQILKTGWWSSNDKGYFADIIALNTAYPTWSDWWYAVLWSTDTIWIWDSGTSAWVDSWAWGSWSWDVAWPASATDNAIARFDTTTGKLIQNSAATIDDSWNITATNLSGTNTGNQTSIVGITGTKAQFDTAVTDWNILYVGDITQYTDEMAQDATWAMVDTSLVYTDGTPLLQRAALTGAITASVGSNATALGSFTTAQLNTALSDNDIATGGWTASGTNTGDNAANTTYASDYRAANFVAWTNYVAPNAAITGATKTKITYDAKGLVTAGADATTADIADSTNKRYVTDANLTTIGNQSGTNTGDNSANSLYSWLVSNATHTWDVTGATALTIDKTAITGKTGVTAVWTDYVLISDTSDTGNLKKALISDFAWWVSDGDKWDISVSSSGTVWTLDEPALRKSETSINNSPLFYTLNKFDSLQTNFYGTGTVALDTTIEAEGTGCMKLTLDTGWNCWPRVAFTTPVNFYQKAMTIKCRASAWANITTAEILFGTDSSFSNYYIFQWKGSSNGKLVTPPDNEWIERVFNAGDCMVWAGAPNWNSISHVIIRALAGTWTPDFYVDDFMYFEANQKPMVCVTFDDSLSTQFSNGKAKLDQYNIKGTFYCIWDLIGTATYMTQTEVDTLSVQWHDISGHWQTNLTSLSSADQITDLRGMKKWLVTGGYRGSNNYALPNGAYTDAVLANVRKYFNSIANIDWLSNTKEYSPNYLINRFSPDSWTSTATIQAWIDNAIANNNMAIIAWHWIVPSGATWAQVTQATYDTIMDYIGTKKNNGDIDTWTLTDYYATQIISPDYFWASDMVAAWIYF